VPVSVKTVTNFLGAEYVGTTASEDVTTGALVAMGSGQQTEWEHRVELDPSGRYGFFATTATALPADGNGHTDFYRRDLDGGVAGPLVLVTTDSDGRVVGGPIGAVAPSEYGRLFAADASRLLVLTSQALVSGDTNRLRDLYAKDLATGIAGSPLG
jgi:large repetitive protein